MRHKYAYLQKEIERAVMKLDIKAIENGKFARFEDSYDFSEMEFYGRFPIAEPLVFRGQVTRRAGGWMLEGELSTNLHLICDRCLQPFQRVKTLPVTQGLELSLQNEERDDIIVCPKGLCDLQEIAETEWVLDMEYQDLCNEACKGLCAICGCDFNQGSCEHIQA